MNIGWPGVIDPAQLKPAYVVNINRLADAAKAGNWAEVFAVLDSEPLLGPNHWRISGKSWFTPLHQAAWLGAPVDVVEQLIQRGAWLSLRNAAGERAVDIALKQGHQHLVESLEVREPLPQEAQKFAAWDRHLAELISERTSRLDPVRIRSVPTEVIALDQLEGMWFAYPGMYGGFSLSIHKDRLCVESWIRVVGGSGQAHVITENGCVLVDKGFV